MIHQRLLNCCCNPVPDFLLGQCRCEEIGQCTGNLDEGTVNKKEKRETVGDKWDFIANKGAVLISIVSKTNLNCISKRTELLHKIFIKCAIVGSFGGTSMALSFLLNKSHRNLLLLVKIELHVVY